MALADENAGVVDGLGKTELVDASLQAALQEILVLQGQHVIELHARLVEHADAHKAANEGIAFEEALGVLLVEGEELTVRIVSDPESRSHGVARHCGGEVIVPGSTTNLGESKLDSPHFSLVSQAVLADELQFGVTGIGASVSITLDLNRGKLVFSGR